MNIGIQQLIDKEREAESLIEEAVASKEEAKKRAIQDAELALGIIQTEHNRKIGEIEKESEAHLERLRKELREEYDSYSKLLESKDTSKTVQEIIKIITGESKGF